MFLTNRVFTYFIILVFLCFGCKKDVPESLSASSVSGVKLYNDGYGALLRSFEATADGGYMFGGMSTSSPAQGGQGFIQKCDKYGNVNWYQTYGGTGNDYFYVVHNTSDGGCIAGGSSNSLGGKIVRGYPYLVKVDGKGKQLWQKCYVEHNQNGNFYDVRETPDHGYVATGFINSKTSNPLFIIKTDKNGDSLWGKEIIQVQKKCLGASLAFGPNGEIAIAGLVQQGNNLSINYPAFTYLSQDGTIILQKTFTQFGSLPWANNGNTWGYEYGSPVNFEKIVSRPDGFIFIISSDVQNYPSVPGCLTCGIALSVTIFKIDFNGNIMWNHTFKGLGSGVVFNDAINNADDGLLISGGATDASGLNYCWLLNTDATGNKTSECYTPLNGTKSWATGAINTGKGYAIGFKSIPINVNRVGFFGILTTDLNGKIIDGSK